MFCTQCSNEVGKNIRICPQCGGRTFSDKITEVRKRARQQAPPEPGYTPSAATGTSSGSTGSVSDTFVYAGFWKRVGAALLDWLIVLPLSFFLGVAAGVVVGLIGIGLGMSESDTIQITNILTTILSILLAWLWYAKFESSRSRATPGKRIMKLKVVDCDGNRISFGRASGRHFSKIFSGLLLGIGFLMVAFTKDKQGLHDRIAHTYVVRQPLS